MAKKKKNTKAWQCIVIVAAAVTLVAAAIAGIWAYRALTSTYSGEDTRIYIPSGSTAASVGDTLRLRLGDDFGSKVYDIWALRKGSPRLAQGSYLVKNGARAVDISRRLLSGAQDPVKVVFNNVRTLQQLAAKVSPWLELSEADFLAACDSVLGAEGLSKAEYPAAFIPDTYEFYWDAAPAKVVSTLWFYTSRFWNDSRKAKAAQLGLTPAQVATIASIVEEETAKADERPKVARLYLNRLDRGMKLQADPTVKYAVGDFTLRRILGQHLKVDSPYNTYMYVGLPPGPIRIPEGSTIDAVLSAPEHGYIYMCAKDDFSGYHNFASTGDEHMRNARRYHEALNRRGVR